MNACKICQIELPPKKPYATRERVYCDKPECKAEARRRYNRKHNAKRSRSLEPFYEDASEDKTTHIDFTPLLKMQHPTFYALMRPTHKVPKTRKCLKCRMAMTMKQSGDFHICGKCHERNEILGMRANGH